MRGFSRSGRADSDHRHPSRRAMFETSCLRPARDGWLLGALLFVLYSVALVAQQPAQEAGGTQTAPRHAGGEANLVLPDLGTVEFQGINGRTLLMGGLGVCVLGLAFG